MRFVLVAVVLAVLMLIASRSRVQGPTDHLPQRAPARAAAGEGMSAAL